MLGTQFLDYVSKMQVATYVGVEDFADKFNFLLTVMVLLLCTAIVTVKQYILKPISCYIATEVGGKNLLEYVENYCWVQGTIPISYTVSVPENEEQWKKLESQKLLYYQWVPFVLGLQCILFYLPRVIWQMICYNRTGTDLQHLVTLASQAVHSQMDKREEMVQHLAESLEQLLFQRCSIKEEKTRKRRFRWTGISKKEFENPDFLDLNESTHEEKERLSLFERFLKYRSSLIAPAYFFVKMLYLINAVGQLYLMQIFLGFGHNDKAYGLQVLQDMLQGRDWQATLIFPRVAFCYAEVKNLGSRDNAVTAQCALPVNMLNEKIYVFLWWWILVAACLTLISTVVWLFKVLGSMKNAAYVRRSLQMSTGVRFNVNDVRLFTNKFLRHDGVFVVRIIAANAGTLIASDLLRVLWNHFKEREDGGKVDPLTNHTRLSRRRPYMNMPTCPDKNPPAAEFLNIDTEHIMIPLKPLDSESTRKMSNV